ncbi:endonuclease/exonuclease/phosphatase family protein [Nocardioides mangrovi]|uniref:Endonuclease/exonuclease/phosphatase family protein n=1 Tax=Nocardioides mangrovi TaxID=2874580 RepID=A0ABS7UDD5_9ACTN|nr:endonuclease/exonuclease/phosphatase family protein [Nocardioides mangrovi]MBZ5739013.1 endonuclease/exonuclease/phosphatase family protein [Nocardioides mangrovi]
MRTKSCLTAALLAVALTASLTGTASAHQHRHHAKHHRHHHAEHRHQVVPQRLHLAQANLKQGEAKFAADLAEVTEGRPDFVTLNEAGYRTDEEIRPQGYDAYRGLSSPYTRETPVLWRKHRWEAIGHGTRWMTRRQVRWGQRAVNWVTLRSTRTGNVVSVVSAHPAPTLPRTEGLLPKFAKHLVTVVTHLEKRGPVLVGGDLNSHYTSSLFPRTIFDKGGLTSTYATFGMPVGGTGDHGGATIDYLLYTSGLVPKEQSTAELHSDHDAVFGTFKLGS